MHMLCHFATSGYEAWKSDFDDDAEKRRDAGLTLLQMWRGADDASAVTCLFEVNDRGRAETWLKTESALGAPADARFLRTA